MKTCVACGTAKPLPEFYPRPQSRDGIHYLCKPCCLQRSKTWTAKNAAKVKASRAAHYAANIDKKRAADAVNRAKPGRREKAREVSRLWRINNREGIRAARQRRRARLRGAEGTHKAADIRRLHEVQKGKCAACKCGLGTAYQVDHILPLSLGGTNWPSNLQLLCHPCNNRKSAKRPERFMQECGYLL